MKRPARGGRGREAESEQAVKLLLYLRREPKPSIHGEGARSPVFMSATEREQSTRAELFLAPCETGHLQARVEATFKDGAFLSGVFIKPCQVRR